MHIVRRLATAALILNSSAATPQVPDTIPHIGFLRAEAPDAFLDAFRDGLLRLGYEDRKNIVIEPRWANVISIDSLVLPTSWSG